MSHEEIKRCGAGHDHDLNHLCQIVVRRDIGRVKELVKDAQFYCKNCGRAAHNENNLCNPSRI